MTVFTEPTIKAVLVAAPASAIELAPEEMGAVTCSAPTTEVKEPGMAISTLTTTGPTPPIVYTASANSSRGDLGQVILKARCSKRPVPMFTMPVPLVLFPSMLRSRRGTTTRSGGERVRVDISTVVPKTADEMVS